MMNVSPPPPSQGFVMLEADGGAATSVVVPGANGDWGRASRDDFLRVLRGAALLLLQREVPENVNALALDAAAELGVPVILVSPAPPLARPEAAAGGLTPTTRVRTPAARTGPSRKRWPRLCGSARTRGSCRG